MIRVGGLTVPCPLCGVGIKCTVEAATMSDDYVRLVLTYDHDCRRNGQRPTDKGA